MPTMTIHSRLLSIHSTSFRVVRDESRNTFYMKSVDGSGEEYWSKSTLEPREYLFSGMFNRVRLEEEIRRAASYHSMCSLVIFDVN